MAYEKLNQIRALSKTITEAGLVIEPFPKLKSQSNTHIAEFNSEVEAWVQLKLVVAIRKALTELAREPLESGVPPESITQTRTVHTRRVVRTSSATVSAPASPTSYTADSEEVTADSEEVTADSL